MPKMRETAYATCQTVIEGTGRQCMWAESGPNVWNAALVHEEENPLHVVLVGEWH